MLVLLTICGFTWQTTAQALGLFHKALTPPSRSHSPVPGDARRDISYPAPWVPSDPTPSPRMGKDAPSPDSAGHAGRSLRAPISASPIKRHTDARRRVAQRLDDPSETDSGFFQQLGGELSLQESLDRLGYTVNVPTVFEGHTLKQWGNGYRTSTTSDTLSEKWFAANGIVTSRMLSQQTALSTRTTFGIAPSPDQGERRTFLSPAGDERGNWLSTNAGKTDTEAVSGVVRFFIDVEDPTGSFPSGVYTTDRRENAARYPRVIILPARQGGSWLDEGNNTGHWEGGSGDGYLFCWEDWVDDDYQDFIILVKEIQPVEN